MYDIHENQQYLPCIWPFTYVGIEKSGDVFLCPCRQWTSMGSVGNIKQNTLSYIWNSRKALQYRNIIFNSKIDTICNRAICPYLLSRKNVQDSWHYLAPEILTNIGKRIPKLPVLFSRVKLDTDNRCNLACIMCRKKKNIDDPYSITDIALKRLTSHWHHIQEFCPSTSGEMFFMPDIINLLESDLFIKNNIEIEAVTNGLLFNLKIWNKIKHNKICLKISIDSLIKEKYERIRRGADFKTLLKNVEFVSMLRTNNYLLKTQIAMLVMKSNYQEIDMMVKFGEKMHFDKVKFLTLNGTLAPDEHLSSKDKKILIAKLGDTIFKDPIVDLWSLLPFYPKQNGNGHPAR